MLVIPYATSLKLNQSLAQSTHVTGTFVNKTDNIVYPINSEVTASGSATVLIGSNTLLLKTMNIFNNGSVPNVYTVVLDNGTPYSLIKVTVAPGQTLQYTPETGFFVKNSWAAINYPSISRNGLMNANFNIRQRDWTNPLSTHTKVSDKWIYTRGDDGAVNVSKDTDVPDGRSKYSLKVACSTVDSVIGSSQYSVIEQRIEGYNALRFVGQQATLSFWVKSNKTGTYCVSIRNNAPDRTYVAEYTINSANTWEFKTITLTFNYSGGTWDFADGTGLRLAFVLACGSSLQTTANAWQSGNYLATSNQVNLMDSNTNTWQIARPQFELGAVATDFEFIDYGTELWRCQRYYEKSEGNNDSIWSGYATSGQNYYTNIYFKNYKRVAPSSGTVSIVAANFLNFPNTASGINIDTISFLRLQRTANGNGHAYFSDQWTVDVEL